ncbi:MAG: hypothetical protein ACI86H_000174 [bacterium]|jgi:hypothetical protein
MEKEIFTVVPHCRSYQVQGLLIHKVKEQWIKDRKDYLHQFKISIENEIEKEKLPIKTKRSCQANIVLQDHNGKSKYPVEYIVERVQHGIVISIFGI